MNGPYISDDYDDGYDFFNIRRTPPRNDSDSDDMFNTMWPKCRMCGSEYCDEPDCDGDPMAKFYDLSQKVFQCLDMTEEEIEKIMIERFMRRNELANQLNRKESKLGRNKNRLKEQEKLPKKPKTKKILLSFGGGVN